MKGTSPAVGSLLLGLIAMPALADYANDRAEIENLSARYMLAVDAGDIDTVMATWTDDGVLEWGNGVEKGAAAIRKAMSNFGGESRWTNELHYRHFDGAALFAGCAPGPDT